MSALPAWALLEPLLVALAIGVAALHALRVLWPAGWRRARTALALVLVRRGGARGLVLARRLSPGMTAPAAAASGCGPCRGCDRPG